MTTGRRRRRGFTLIELLVSIAILVVLMGIIFQIIQMTSQAWTQSSQSTGTMQQARVAFERMTRNLSEATLNTYYAYYPFTPPAVTYVRYSELQFVSGYGLANSSPTALIPVSGTTNPKQVTHAVFFQAPLGVVNSTTTYGYLGNLLNACGYFVIYGTDPLRPAFLTSAGFANAPAAENRYRLMEYLQPSDYFNLYTGGAVSTTGTTLSTWIGIGVPHIAANNILTNPPVTPVCVRPLASNIVALIIMPEQFANGVTTNGEANTQPVYSSAASTYNYDSAYNTTPTLSGGVYSQIQTANQLPPLVRVVMVAIDEASAIRLAAKYPSATSTAPPDLGQLSTSSPVLFHDPTQLSADLATFEADLTANKLNYYVFQTDVIIRGARWSH